MVVVIIQGPAKAVEGTAGEYNASGLKVTVEFAEIRGEDVRHNAIAMRAG